MTARLLQNIRESVSRAIDEMNEPHPERTSMSKSAAKRLYAVTDSGTDKPTTYLVEAPTAAQAVRRVTEPRFHVSVPSGVEIVELMSAGATVLKDGGA